MAFVLVLLTVIACLLGLAVPGVYRDNAAVTWGWFGNDLVTLLAAVPALVLVAQRTDRRSRLLQLGLLYFTLYNYLFYLFGAAFNQLFLLYAAIVVLGALALLRAARDPDLPRLAGVLQRTALHWVAGYLLLVGLMMGGVHVSAALSFLFTGHLPGIVISTGHPTNVVAALDLAMVVTPSLLGACRLWQGRPEGFLLAILVNVKGAFYMLALTAATLSAARAGTGVDPTQAWLWGSLGLGCLASTGALLAAKEDNTHASAAITNARR